MKYILWVAVVVALIIASWSMLKPIIVNTIFQDELQDTAAELDFRFGLADSKSSEELRDIVIRKAAKHDIELGPKQVIVRIRVMPHSRIVLIQVDYTELVNLYIYSYSLHFTPQCEVQKPLY
jgi:hypothetical protein